MKRVIKTWLVFMLLLPLCVLADKRVMFDVVPVQIGEHSFTVQLADTFEKRAQGLMFAKTAEPGMLLVYSEPREISLWMVNTSMALDVAYIGPDWTITEFVKLEPFDDTPVPSKFLSIAALEMPRGWFDARGITVGQKMILKP